MLLSCFPIGIFLFSKCCFFEGRKKNLRGTSFEEIVLGQATFKLDFARNAAKIWRILNGRFSVAPTPIAVANGAFECICVSPFETNRWSAFNIESVSGYHPAKLNSYDSLIKSTGFIMPGINPSLDLYKTL